MTKQKPKMSSKVGGSSSSTNGTLSSDQEKLVDEEFSRLTISAFQAREEEIERKKMEVKEKVELQLGRAEEVSRRLNQISEELEVLGDPMRREVAVVRKKVDITNKELKSLGLSCQKKEKEYKEALEFFNEKNKEKTQLVTALMELLAESERLRMRKLEELGKNIEYLH